MDVGEAEVASLLHAVTASDGSQKQQQKQKQARGWDDGTSVISTFSRKEP